MKLKKILGSLLVGGVMLTNTSCEDFTEIQPKGTNLLTTVTQLEMLLNYEFYFMPSDWQTMSGDMLYAYSHVPSMISQPNKTRNVIMWTFDEANMDKMAELTSSDDDYGEFFGIIGKICNPILSKIDAAEGDDATKVRIKAEALTLRAYFHWLLVNKFAKAYNPSTAANDPGIAYLLETQDITQPTEKLTVQQVYDYILDDINAAIELDALPDVAVNRMRMCKPAAYAVKAWALASMQQFDEAAAAAKQALAINSVVNDYNSPEMTTETMGYITGGSYPSIYREQLKCEEDLFFTYGLEFFNNYGPEAWALFEDGHACRDRIATAEMMYDYMMNMAESTCGITGFHTTYDMNSVWNMVGLKTTHMYLIVAEAEIHKGNFDAAMEALDKIRVGRINPEVYAPLKGIVTTQEDAMFRLKQTSHGENIYSLYNFIQRKRWNQVSGWEETIERRINENVYTMTPDSPMWIFPFGRNVTDNNPNMTQNYK